MTANSSKNRKRSRPEEEPTSASESPNLDGDRLNVLLLTSLYTIQFLPRGLALAFPVILQSRKTVTYGEQATFSVSTWSVGLKIFWAPIIDAVCVRRLGRRKSWLIPIQTLMGLSLLYMAYNIDDWLPESGKPNLDMLTTLVFFVIMLSTTQDVVVDGWALTMLKKNNVTYASTCNVIGLLFGTMAGSIFFTLLISEDFANRYLRTLPGAGGLMTMKSFLCWSGVVILTVSFLVATFKKEKDNRSDDGYVKLNILQTYKLLWDVLRLPHVRTLAIALLTMTAGSAAIEKTIFSLKLIDAGVPKDDIMLVRSMTYGLKLFIPFLASKYVTGPKPMSYYLIISPLGLLWATAYAALIYYTPSLIRTDEFASPPVHYYLILGTVTFVYEVLGTLMLLLISAFVCRLSDPDFGCTYMTFYNTLVSLGHTVSHTVALKSVQVLTVGQCSNDDANACWSSKLKNSCKANGGSCEIYVDGYYVIAAISTVVGFVWLVVFKNALRDYQTWSLSRWLPHVKSNDTPTEESELKLMLTTTSSS